MELLVGEIASSFGGAKEFSINGSKEEVISVEKLYELSRQPL